MLVAERCGLDLAVVEGGRQAVEEDKDRGATGSGMVVVAGVTSGPSHGEKRRGGGALVLRVGPFAKCWYQKPVLFVMVLSTCF